MLCSVNHPPTMASSSSPEILSSINDLWRTMISSFFKSRRPVFAAAFFLLPVFFYSWKFSTEGPAANFALNPRILASVSYQFCSAIGSMNSLLVPPFIDESDARKLVVPVKNLPVRVSERKESSTDRKVENEFKDMESCDLFNGDWVLDDSKPMYSPGSCPFIDDAFNCARNGRPDSDFMRLRWQPSACSITRLDGKTMLEMLRGKKMVFVGDSLNRNMWESLACILRESLEDKSRVFEISGRTKFKTGWSYAFRFSDYNCSIGFVRSPFLVQELEVYNSTMSSPKPTLRLDVIDSSSSMYQDADIIIFNTGHWWTHEKTSRGKNYYQEGAFVHPELSVTKAYKKALSSWAKWVDENINPNKTRVFFRGFSATHFRGGQWNSGGSCDWETTPITDDSYLKPYPKMMRILESVMAEMATPVVYLNITRMTDFRKDGHPSIFRDFVTERHSMHVQDCSHWCLPGVPDAWNEILYALLLIASKHD
ncbi:protein trichome birefringence-like 4 [Aristolochia californica]|uniref:protein trichome birefringence-like 4 n=1 Tax=Aristolochia californica TaxID=171875 RepID=UPI0035D57BAD